MPKVTFEGDTQQEIVVQVKRWLASLDVDADGQLTVQQAIAQGADLTKDALRIVAAAAPKPIAQNELVRALTDMGYKATDVTRDRLVNGLESVEAVTGGGVVRRVSKAGREAVFEMNATIAKQLLRTLAG